MFHNRCPLAADLKIVPWNPFPLSNPKPSKPSRVLPLQSKSAGKQQQWAMGYPLPLDSSGPFKSTEIPAPVATRSRANHVTLAGR
jgi:hypothetical protein